MLNQDNFFDVYKSIVNQKKKPILTIDATSGEVIVPRDYIDENGFIILSICPNAVRDLKIKHQTLYCRASFDKQIVCISVPLSNVKNLFAA